MCNAGGANFAANLVSIYGRNESESYQKNMWTQEQQVNQQLGEASLRQGTTLEEKKRADTAKLMGTQRAQMGASGLEVNAGTFSKLSTDTAGAGEADALTIRRNALMKAWEYQVKNTELENKKDKMSMEGVYKDWGTLLGSGGSMINSNSGSGV